jgi:hypothetical protein
MYRGDMIRLLFLAVTVGLVLMHHVVAAHQHADDLPVAPATATAGPVTPASAPAAALHVHGEHGEHGEPAGSVVDVLHACLAMLVTAVVVVAALFVLGWAPERVVPRGLPATRVPSRGLPVPLVLARLQVLRL